MTDARDRNRYKTNEKGARLPEEDNPMELWLGLALSSRLESHTRRSLRHLFEESRRAAIPLGKPQPSTGQANSYKDRQGADMQAIGAIDFGCLPMTDVTALTGLPTSGRLTIFCSPQILSLPPKERRNFKLAFTDSQNASSAGNPGPEQGILPLTIDEGSRGFIDKMDQLGINSLFRDEICAAARAYNITQAGQNYVLGAALLGMDEDLEVSAFASGGISHNAARAKDPHYAHLVEESKQWKLLARLRQFSEDSALKEARVYIRKQDLSERLFDRAWLICR